MARFAECYGESTKGIDVATAQEVPLSGTLAMQPWSVYVLDLR